MSSFASGSFRLAAREIRTHPLRTFLLSQGIIWAIALVVVPAAVIEGSRRDALERARELDTDLIRIGVDSTSGGEERFPVEGDVTALRAELPEGCRLSALRVKPARLSDASSAAPPVWLLGYDEELRWTRKLELRAGRFPSPGPRRPDEPVEVALEEKAAQALDGSASVVGRRFRLQRLEAEEARIRVLAERQREESPGIERTSSEGNPSDGGTVCEVVGVVAPPPVNVDLLGNDLQKALGPMMKGFQELMGIHASGIPFLESGRGIYIPRDELPGERIQWMFLRGDPALLEKIEEVIERVLVGRGRTPLIYTNTLASIITKPELDSYFVLHEVFFFLYLVIGLLVLTNLLLLSGWRRRGEIALRRAEGARRSDIFREFLAEGVLLAGFGLVVGVILGMLIAKLRVAIDPGVALTLTVPWGTILRCSVIFAGGALLASVYPAWKASGHAPISLLKEGS